VPHGVRETRSMLGLPLLRAIYVNGLREGPATEFGASGARLAEGVYHQDRKQGTWTLYGREDLPTAIEPYEGGVLEGQGRLFEPAGTLSEEITYHRGKREGPATEYWSSGIPRAKGLYAGGNKQGPWEEWNAAGVLIRRTQWEAGKKVGGEGLGAAGTKDMAASAEQTPAPGNARDIFTESHLRAGHTLDWWESRLNAIRRRDPRPTEAGLYGLTLERARANGFVVSESADGVRLSPPEARDGGTP